jgi:hypothetical protein
MLEIDLNLPKISPNLVLRAHTFPTPENLTNRENHTKLATIIPQQLVTSSIPPRREIPRLQRSKIGPKTRKWAEIGVNQITSVIDRHSGL